MGRYDTAQEDVEAHENVYDLYKVLQVVGTKLNERLKNKGGLKSKTSSDDDSVITVDWKSVNHGGEVAEIEYDRRIGLIETVCTEAMKIFTRENRVLEVHSPIVVFGDIHGNFSDLLTYAQNFWPYAPHGVNNDFLFLGDYVDRGNQSLEVFLYLLCMKCIFPENFFLLRGNHEVSQMQRLFSFRVECLAKFPRGGPEVWKWINNVMDCMPVCATIDQRIFCSHGGIPYVTDIPNSSEKRPTTLADLEAMPRPMVDPENDFPPAWEIMWNDPAKENTREMRKRDESDPEFDKYGYAENKKRGAGYFFDEKALDNFCEANGLSHVIRAHEMETPGYRIYFKGKLITIFSCSGYCGHTNTAACLFVQDGKISIVQLETRR